MFRNTLLTAVRMAMGGCVMLVAALVLAGELKAAYFSIEGDVTDPDDQVDLHLYLARDVGSSETLYFQTFGGPGYGGTSAAGDAFTAGTKIDSVLKLFDSADQSRGTNDDYWVGNTSAI